MGQIRDFDRRRRSGHLNDILLVDPTDHEFRAADGRPADRAHMVDLIDRVQDAYAFAVGRARRPSSRITPMGQGGVVTHSQTWYLGSASYALAGPEGGSLSASPDALPRTFVWMHDPADPVLTQIDWLWGQLRDGLPDESRTHLRNDVATFTAAECRTAQTLLGEVRLGLNMRVRGHDAHVVAELCDVHPDGKAVQIVGGVSLVRARDGWQHVLVDLGFVGYTLETGHRLRLSIAASSYPQYPVDPGAWGRGESVAQDIVAQTGNASFISLTKAPIFEAYQVKEG